MGWSPKLVNPHSHINSFPMHYLRKFQEASQDASGRAMRALFGNYIECQEDWMTSSLVLSERTTDAERIGGKYSWLTKPDTQYKIMMHVLFLLYPSIRLSPKKNIYRSNRLQICMLKYIIQRK